MASQPTRTITIHDEFITDYGFQTAEQAEGFAYGLVVAGEVLEAEGIQPALTFEFVSDTIVRVIADGGVE